MRSQGNYFGIKADITSNTVDPRTTSVPGKKGTVYRYIPAIGDAVLLVKQDDGDTMNWFTIGGGGGSAFYIEGAGDPSQAPGVTADQGTVYTDTSNPGIYNKIGPLDTDWLKVDNTTGDKFIKLITTDPTTGPGVPATIGTIGIQTSIPSNLYFKFDAGNTDWVILNKVMGTANRGAYFSNAGVLTTDSFYVVREATKSASIASIVSGTVSISGEGSFATGKVSNSGIININPPATGGRASGFATDSGIISVIGVGSTVEGYAVGNNGTNPAAISADLNALGGKSFGYVSSISGVNAIISSRSPGSLAFGANYGGLISAGNDAIFGRSAVAFGKAAGGGIINSQGTGSLVFGAADSDSQLSTSNSAHGSFVQGYVAGGNIHCASPGSFAGGYCLGDNTTQIMVTAAGSHARGWLNSPGAIIDVGGVGSFVQASLSGINIVSVTSPGSVVIGHFDNDGAATVNGGGSGIFGAHTKAVTVNGTGCFFFGAAMGNTVNMDGLGILMGGTTSNGSLISSGGIQGAMAWGDNITLGASYSFAFGNGHVTNGMNQFFAGKFVDNSVPFLSFAIGYGVAGVPKNSFETRTNGTHKFGGAEILKVNSPVGNSTINVESPFTFFVPGSAPYNTNLPAAPENGELYRFRNASGSGVAQTIDGNGHNIVFAGMADSPTYNLPDGGYIELVYIQSAGKWYNLGSV